MRVLLLASALVLSQASEHVCTDIDFDQADVVVSNFGGTKYCCNICSDDPGMLCCPTVEKDESVVRAIDTAVPAPARTHPAAPSLRQAHTCTTSRFSAMRIQIIVKVPYTTNNARQILDKDYLMYNVCHGTPGAELQGVIPPDKDGDTSYMKLQGVQTDPDVSAISLILKNRTEYYPVWPVLGICDNEKCNQKDFHRDHANGDSLKPAGYLNNGRKTGTLQANDLLQINLCSNRILALEACFVDDDNAPVVLSNAALRFFDIDHGKQFAQGPEVMQFMCTGGSFTLYGYEQDGKEDTEFMVHMSKNAQVLKRPSTGEFTINGLPINVFDCPNNEWVTIWSSRIGVGKDNPITSVIPQDPVNGKAQERSMVQIDFVEQDCMKVNFANMPVAYHQHLKDTRDMDKIDRLYASLELTPENYPDIGKGDCGYAQSGRNWLFAGLKGEKKRDCSPSPPPPSPPSPPPPPPSPTCDTSQCAHGQYAVLTDASPSPSGSGTRIEWNEARGNPDCGTKPDGTISANRLYDRGTGVSLADCKALCERNARCTEITWAPSNEHCVLFDGCDNPGPNDGWEHWVPDQTNFQCTDTDNGATGSEGQTCSDATLTPAMCDSANAGEYDDDDFTASVMCCACGGGYKPFSPGTVAPPPAASAPPMGSCVQLDAASDGWLTADCEREISTQGEPQPCPEPCP